MSISTIHENELHVALDGMTGAVDIIEATFTPWDDDQLVALEGILTELAGLDRVEDALRDAA